MKKNKSFIFRPFSIKQQQLMYWWQFNSPHKNKDIVIADGAIRSGKTIAMICSFVRWSLCSFKGEEFIIAGKSIGALKRNVIKPMLQILEAWGLDYEFNRSSNFITVGSNTYYLFGANNEASQDVLQGLTAAGALADEVALFPESFVDQMISRCSVENSKIFMNCNPKGPYHYFKQQYIEKIKDKNIYYLHFDMEDNLTLSQKVKERYQRMFSGVFFKRYILGLWVMAEGIIFDMFSEEKHKIITEDREYIEYYIACDYGTLNPTTFGLWGNHNNKWIKVKEYYYSGRDKGIQKTDEEFYKDLEDFTKGLDIKAIIIDPSAASFITTIRKHNKFKVKKAKNEVLRGIRNMGTALQEQQILYNDCCINTFREFYSYVWDSKAADRGEDKPTKEHDHCLDSDRYFVNTILFRKQTGFRVLS